MPGSRRTMLNLVIDAGADIGVLGGVTALNANNTEARLVSGAIRRTASEICSRGLLVREHSFYTLSGRTSYALPADYFLPWTNSAWNRSDQWPIRNISHRELQSNKSGFTASSVHQNYRILPTHTPALAYPDHYTQRRFHIDPTPTSREKISFLYRSDHWIDSFTSDAVESLTLASDAVVTVTATAHGLSPGAVVGFYSMDGAEEMNDGSVYTIITKTTDTFNLLGTDGDDFVTKVYPSTGAEDSVEGVTLVGSNAVQIDAVGHGRSNGDQVKFSGVAGTTELNGNSYLIESVAADTFDLTGTDSSDFTAWTSGGTFIPWTPGGSFKVLTDYNGVGDGTTQYPLVPGELLERGIAYRLRQRMGFSYFDHKREYEDLLELYVGNAHGDHIINMGGPRSNNYVGVPEGNFPSS